MSGQIKKNDIISEEALKVFSEIVLKFEKLLIEAKKMKSGLKDSGFDELTEDAKKAKRALTEVEKAERELLKIREKQIIATSRLGLTIADEKVKLNEINRVNREAAKTKQGLMQSNRGLLTSFKNLIKSVGAYALAYVGLQKIISFFTNTLFNLTKKLDSQHFSMTTVIKDQRELTETTIFLSKISVAYGLDILTLTERYIKFRAAAQQSNITAQDTMRIFDSVAKAAAVLGLKTDEVNGVFLALEQMISKGKVTTEELRRQLGERLPGAFGIMADALGISISELDKMLKAGEILSDEALPKFAIALEKAYGIEALTSVDNLAAAHGRLRTSWVEFVEELGANKAYISALNGLNNILLDIQNAFGAYSTELGLFIKFQDKAGETTRKMVSDLDEIEFGKLILGSREYRDSFVKAMDQASVSAKKAGIIFDDYVERRRRGFLEDQKTARKTRPFDIEEYKKVLSRAKKEFEGLAATQDEILREQAISQSAFYKEGAETYKKFIRSQGDELKAKTKEAELLFKTEESAQKEMVDSGKEVTKEQKQELKRRLENFQNYIDASILLNAKLAELEKKGSKQSAADRWQFWKKINDDIAKGEKEAMDDRVKFAEDALKEEEKILKEKADAVTENDDKLLSDTYDIINEKALALSEAATEELEDSKNVARQKRLIELQLNKDILQLEADELQKKIDSGELSVEAEKKFADRILQIKEALEKGKRDLFDETQEINKKKALETIDFIGQLGQAGINLQGTLNDAATQRAENRYNREIQLAGESADKQLVAKRKLEAEERKIATREAKRRKVEAIFSVGIDIAKAIAQFGFISPQAILAGIVGAITLAGVIATPLPQYAEGIKEAPGGLAILGDAKGNKLKPGGKEMVKEPSGKTWLSGDSPGVYNIVPGSEVIPHDKTMQELAQEATNSTYDTIDMGMTNKILTDMRDKKTESITYKDGYKIITRPGYIGKFKV
jgi:tape measure domain-containing protein